MTILAGWMLAILVCFVPILILYDIGDDQALEDDQHWQLSKLIFAGILIYIGHGLPLCVIFGLNIR